MRHYPTMNIHQLNTGADHAEYEYQPLLATWTIKIVIFCGWHRKIRATRVPEIFEDDDFYKLTGIVLPFEADEDGDIKRTANSYSKISNAKILKLLKARQLELAKIAMPNDLPLLSNVEILGDIVGLSQTEKVLLVFATALTAFPEFRKVISARNHSVTTNSLAKILAATLGVPTSEIQTAMREDGLLALTGIVATENGYRDFDRKIEVTDRFAEILLLKGTSKEDLISNFLKSASQPKLGLADYPHLANDIQVLSAYLTMAVVNKEPGVNVLFYGAPGTGKTELVKALAMSLQANLYEISYVDEAGDAVKGSQRLKAYNLCQHILAQKQNAMLLFDEVEDVFEKQHVFTRLFGAGGDSEKGKAWINRSLEMSSTPAIWVTNDENIDPAYLRRFDYSIRFPIPPQKVRQKIARLHLGQFNPTEDWLTQIAVNDQISPGQLERAAKVARIAGASDFEAAKKMVEQTLERSITLLGQKRVPSRNVLRTAYNLDFINTDFSALKLVDAMKNKPSGSFCFFGPAGTGKSELARYMADEIGKPMLLKRASDILSMWVGGSEKNIADMFAEARQQDAVLVLDEADSFLADRRDAKQSWEVTQVNELLTQMEAFDGIFVCTTNLMKRLDQASLRRFAFKVKFDYLNSDQRWAMFRQELQRLGCDVNQACEWEGRVRKLETLTPGDFAVVARQAAMLGETPSPGAVYAVLHSECEVKDQTRRPMGFVS